MKLGVKVKDKITGFEGIITGFVTYISGCNQALVVPPVKKDGSLVEAQWFDEQRLIVTNANAIRLNNDKTPGFDTPAPKR